MLLMLSREIKELKRQVCGTRSILLRRETEEDGEKDSCDESELKLPDGVQLPMRTFEEMQTMENALGDRCFRAALVCIFACLLAACVTCRDISVTLYDVEECALFLLTCCFSMQVERGHFVGFFLINLVGFDLIQASDSSIVCTLNGWTLYDAGRPFTIKEL